jgi:hypothetical protein
MWSVGGALAYLAGQSCVPNRLSTSQVPDLGGKKRRSPGNAVCRLKKKRSRKPADLLAKKKTVPQTGQSAAQKKNRRK